ncbi:hypothetical protein Tco_1106456 [Tanacetum coccineum]
MGTKVTSSSGSLFSEPAIQKLQIMQVVLSRNMQKTWKWNSAMENFTGEGFNSELRQRIKRAVLKLSYIQSVRAFMYNTNASRSNRNLQRLH